MFRNNKVFLIKKDGTKRRILGIIPGLFIRFKGHNSTLTLHEPLPRFHKSMIKLGENCQVSIGSSRYPVRKLSIFAESANSICQIGKDFSCSSCEISLKPESNLHVTIGNDCMFAHGIFLRTSDSHTIRSLKNSQITNKGNHIEIGNHVWLGNDVIVLKGCKIANNSVIGLNSVVTKSCLEENSMYAGIPAKFVKNEIMWERECP